MCLLSCLLGEIWPVKRIIKSLKAVIKYLFTVATSRLCKSERVYNCYPSIISSW